MLVKICGITNVEDALAAADAGATAIGLNFYSQSPRYISTATAARIAEALPAHVLKIGVFVNDSPETIAQIAAEVGLDRAQLHGTAKCNALPTWLGVSSADITPLDEAFRRLNPSGPQDALSQEPPAAPPAILWPTAELERIEGRSTRTGAYLLDTAAPGMHGGTGKTFPWELGRAAAFWLQKPIVIAGGLDETNVQRAIFEAQPYGVDVCSRLESAPGKKDRARMKQFIQAALETEL